MGRKTGQLSLLNSQWIAGSSRFDVNDPSKGRAYLRP